MKAKLKPESLLIYEESIICTDNESLKTAEPQGSFEKKTLIITDALAEASEEQVLLDKMLKATGLSMNDIYLLKLNHKNGLWPYIHSIKPENIICFGAHLDTSASTFSHSLYNTVKINDIQLLIANNLSKIITSSKAKQALWNGLKKMFNL